MGSSPQAPEPFIPGPFVPLLENAKTLFALLSDPSFTQALAAPGGAGLDFLSALGGGGGLGDIAGTGLRGIEAGISGQLAPDILADIEARLRPAADRSFQEGRARVTEEAAARGTLNSTGTVSDVGRVSTDIENQLLSDLASIEGALAPVNLQAQAGLSSGLFNSAAGIASDFANRDQAGQLAGLQASLGSLGGVGSFLNSFPLVQPVSGPSKGSQALGLGATIGGSMLGGPAGGKAGGAAANAATDGKGG